MIDERGKIETIANGDFKCVQIIETKKGSIRSNHLHRTGGHHLHVVSGRMIYREFKVPYRDEVMFYKDKEYLVPPPKVVWEREFEVGPGQGVWTGSWIYHQTEFLEDTVLVSCAITPLDHDRYEADTVRMGPAEMAEVWRC